MASANTGSRAALTREWRPIADPLAWAAGGTALALVAGKLTGNRLGLRGEPARDGALWGAATAATVAAVVAAGTALPAVRDGIAERTPPGEGWGWLAWQIPLRTVWTEEMLYRGAVRTWAQRAFGRRRGQLVQAAVFGLSHAPGAYRNGESVLGTVAVTGLAGWVFGELADRTGSLLAPMLAHLAINESGAVATMAIRGRARRLAARLQA